MLSLKSIVMYKAPTKNESVQLSLAPMHLEVEYKTLPIHRYYDIDDSIAPFLV